MTNTDGPKMGHEAKPRRRKWRNLVSAMTLAVFIAGCTQSDLIRSNEVQQDVMQRAEASVPAYRPTNFPARKAINFYLEETEPDSEWYVYLLNEEGTPMFYAVSAFKPLNICVSLSSPDRKVQGRDLVLSAPALDGVYYGGAGCDAFYFQDAATGTFVEIAGTQFSIISTKVPLQLETDLLRFSG